MPDMEFQSAGHALDVESMLNASATGRHLLLGSFVLPKVDNDPTTVTQGVEDGLTVFWVDGTQVMLSIFSADLGEWATTTLGGNDPIGTVKGYVGDLADIPDGWALCDGTNGTHDLVGYLIAGGQHHDEEAPIGTPGEEITDHPIETTSTPAGQQEVQSGTGTTVSSATHQHTVTVDGHSPAIFYLPFIEKVS